MGNTRRYVPAGIDLVRIVEFFRYANERYSIMLRRNSGAPPPWTDDPVLQAYRFCNIFREDDRTTTWFRHNIRDPLRNSSKVIPATIAFRWFNRIETGERIRDILLEDGWNATRVKKALRNVHPIVTGAYMIRTPFGMDKLRGICWYMAHIGLGQLTKKLFLVPFTMQDAHTFLVGRPGLGDFMSYEIVTDLNYTAVLEKAPDKYTWANPGPGATRGLSYIFHTHYHEHNHAERVKMIELMEMLLVMSQDEFKGPRWDMRTVEHTLCEFDKYKRGQRGAHLKRRYVPNQST